MSERRQNGGSRGRGRGEYGIDYRKNNDRGNYKPKYDRNNKSSSNDNNNDNTNQNSNNSSSNTNNKNNNNNNYRRHNNTNNGVAASEENARGGKDNGQRSGGRNVMDWFNTNSMGSGHGNQRQNQKRGALDYLRHQGGGNVDRDGAAVANVSGEGAVQQLARMFPDARVGEIKKEDKSEEKSPTSPVAAAADPTAGAETTAPPPGYRPNSNYVNNANGHGRGGHRGRGRIEIPMPLSQRPRDQQRAHKERCLEAMMPSDPEQRAQWERALNSMDQVVQQLQQQYAMQNVGVQAYSRARLDMDTILRVINEHQITFICSDTGSGKSTGVPKALLELYENARIVSTEPRRTATMAIASRVASLRQQQVGTDVGYWIRGAKCGDEGTRLWYMTSYTLLLHLLASPLQPNFTHIILDEFHERQPDVEVIVALLRLLLLREKAQFKLIIMSATMNTDEWAQYFDGLSVGTYKQEEPEHPIYDYFMEDVTALTGVHYNPPEAFSPDFVDHHILNQSIQTSQRLISFLNRSTDPRHSILVFVPGRAQVDQLAMWVEANHPSLHAIRWHASVELEEIERAIRLVSDRQKIYIATDIAECSITLPDVVFVIDLALVKRPQIRKNEPSTVMYPPLAHQWVSKSSVAQRRGRIGRVQQGFYFCLFPRRHIMSLYDYSAPPIENARIEELSLHCLQLVSNPAAIYGLCRGQPHQEAVAQAMRTLQQLGCILPRNDALVEREGIQEVFDNSDWCPLIMREAQQLLGEELGYDVHVEDYVCTFVGRLLQLIPVSAQQGMLVFYGFLMGIESLAIVTCAVTSSLSPFIVVTKEEEHVGRRKHSQQVDSYTKALEETESVMKEMCCGTRSDVVAAVGAALAFRVEVAKGGGALRTDTLREWCTSKKLSLERMVAIFELENHIKYELGAFVPFHDVEEPQVLEAQFRKLAPLLVIMINAAFAGQALDVLSEGNVYLKLKETASGIFNHISAVPDLHSPSCLRWERNDVVVPITIALHYSKMLVGFATATSNRSQFWLPCLLLAYRLPFTTAEGAYIFAITYGIRSVLVKTDAATAEIILAFRSNCSKTCAALRLRYSAKDLEEEDFTKEILAPRGLGPFVPHQRATLMSILPLFANKDAKMVTEMTDEEASAAPVLDQCSLFSFAIDEP